MIRLNSIAADIKPMLDAQAIYGLIRNTETSEIRTSYANNPQIALTRKNEITTSKMSKTAKIIYYFLSNKQDAKI